ncbi:MAG: PQQ-dependent sugar dehydrogenase [Chloroflexota bacterium]|nr:PQQ-dependent sugar dehydrogenase [Chloroflexota bacterium]
MNNFPAKYLKVLAWMGALLLMMTQAVSGSPASGSYALAQGTSMLFPETGKSVQGKFLDYWNGHGGLGQQGFPISGEMQEKSDNDGKTYTVQYFERAVFEAHPENPAPNDVLLSLLGAQLYKQKYPSGAPGQTANRETGAHLFTETGKSVGGLFRSYWNSHGGLAQQGYPVSEEFTERSDLDGKSYKVQFFQRAILEYHPENQPPYNVLLSQLGTFRLRARNAQVGGGGAGTGSGPQASPTIEPADLKLRPVTVETSDATREGAFAQPRTLNLPSGFHIKLYAAGLSGVRWLGLSPDGQVYATIPGQGKVVILPDANKDGVADSVNVFADNLLGVHGIAFHNGAVYVATQTQIVRLQDTAGKSVADKREVLASDLPVGGGHSTRSLAFSADGTRLFLSAGSSCNVCVETDPKRAAISLYSPDGKFQKVYASGLRNAVGLLVHPLTGELWATNNGRDNIGNDIPPETVYNVKEGANYGWPYCYGTRTPDASQSPPPGYCEKTSVPAVEMQAHSAPLGLAFYTGSNFPADYRGDMFVAFHGSWNRTPPTGYKLVRIRMKNNQPDSSLGAGMVQDFATGWLEGTGSWGRPVDPLAAPDGSLLLTDDAAGVVYRIYYAP